MITPAQAAETLLLRRQARADFTSWCRLCGFEPAKHHQLIVDKLQALVDGKAERRKLMIMMSPGTAKSTYTSKAFPPWYLGKLPPNTILACSYSYTLAESFGHYARNLVLEKANVLGYTLCSDSRAAGEWETTKGGRYFCAGVGAGIAGHRADCGLIDDPLGSQEDADSKLCRDKQWDWYRMDFRPRLKPGAIEILICNRRHEEDLAGRLIASEGNEWDIISLPFYAEENDILGRKVGETIWPEYFDKTISVMVEKLTPRLRAGLYQQRPAPEEGDFFKRDWLQGYEPQDIEGKTLRMYCASDHAISEREDANKTCMGGGGVDENGNLYISPNLFWKRAPADEVIDGMLNIVAALKPIIWRAERGHISKSLMPFIRKRCQERNIYFSLEEVTPSRDKPTRARPIQGRMAQFKVFFPKFASWWGDAEHELLSFPSGKTDDFVDFLAHLGALCDRMTSPDRIDIVEESLTSPAITYGWVKDADKRQKRRETQLEYA